MQDERQFFPRACPMNPAFPGYDIKRLGPRYKARMREMADDARTLGKNRELRKIIRHLSFSGARRPGPRPARTVRTAGGS